MTFIYHYLFIL